MVWFCSYCPARTRCILTAFRLLGCREGPVSKLAHGQEIMMRQAAFLASIWVHVNWTLMQQTDRNTCILLEAARIRVFCWVDFSQFQESGFAFSCIFHFQGQWWWHLPHQNCKSSVPTWHVLWSCSTALVPWLLGRRDEGTRGLWESLEGFDMSR